MSLEGRGANLIVIDEIGKMELFSKKFQNLIKNIFSSIPILATIGLKLNHPIKEFILKMPKVNFYLNRQNQQEVFQVIISLVN